MVALAGAPAFAGDSPPGNFYGSDSNGPTAAAPPAGSALYQEPITGQGTYGGYVAEVGTWTNMTGCTHTRAVNSTDVADANSNAGYLVGSNYPTGTGLYWFMGGPGADSAYNPSSPSATEAYAWGRQQAVAAVKAYTSSGPTVVDPIIFMDIEFPGNGLYNEWNEEVNICGSKTGATPIPYAIDRATFNGFHDYIANYSGGFVPGVYSSPSFWDMTFGTGAEGGIGGTYQWTFEDNSGVTNPGPSDGCQAGYDCAQWFGGVSTSHKFVWQWASNSSGDFDQFYAVNTP